MGRQIAWVSMLSVFPGGREYAATRCVTGPHAGRWRVEQQRVAYLTDEEFAAFQRQQEMIEGA